jgi:serine/threonine protein phosphatase PrpC
MVVYITPADILLLCLQVIAVPEIRHVTLPTTGGRLVIASDGVWDHMQPKSMIHQVNDFNRQQQYVLPHVAVTIAARRVVKHIQRYELVLVWAAACSPSP